MAVSDEMCALEELTEEGIIRKMSYLPELPPVDIEFTDLTYTVPQGRKGSKNILRAVSGLFRSGELTAILGPSGAGKSTLLNALAGYRCLETTGSIHTNGKSRDLAQFKKLSRYIMQQDLLQPKLTVQECMLIAADLKLGKTLSSKQKLVSIDEILVMLRLQKAKNTVTSRLSGGEKKRLSIALELIDNPPIIFLDEPTTGLDDLSCSLCISLLKSLAEGGRTVICSIHTPSARLFEMFDNVYIVAEGQCIFQGNGSNIVPFLASINLHCPLHYNPADFIIEVASGEYGNHLEKMTAAVENGHCYRWQPQTVTEVGSSVDVNTVNESNEEIAEICTSPLQITQDQYDFDSSCWLQFRILVYRMLLQSYRDKSYLLLKLCMHLFLGLVIGGTFYNFGYDASKMLFNFGFCFCCSIVFLYIPMLPILLQYPSEVQLLKREYFNRWYSFNAYFLAVTISRLPSMVILSTMYFVIAYTMTGQPMELHRILSFYGFCLLIALVSESMALAIASSLNLVNAMFVGPTSTVPLMLLAVYGMGQGLDTIPLIWRLAMLTSYVRYGLEGLVISIYGNDRTPLNCPEEMVMCDIVDPKLLLRQMGMDHANVYIATAGLVVSFLIFRAASYLLLRWRLSSYRSFPTVYYVGRIIKRHFNLTQHTK